MFTFDFGICNCIESYDCRKMCSYCDIHLHKLISQSDTLCFIYHSFIQIPAAVWINYEEKLKKDEIHGCIKKRETYVVFCGELTSVC